MHKIIAASLLALLGTACSSSSDSTDGVNPGDSVIQPMVRLKSVIIDGDADNIDDQQITLDYDAAGRVVSHTIEYFSSIEPDQLNTFTYENGLVTSTQDRFGKTNISYVNGLPVLLERFYNDEPTAEDTYSFMHDASGRLSSFVGESLFGNDDCDDVALAPGAPEITEDEMLENVITYENNRLKSIISSNGDTISLVYRADGKVTSLDIGSVCADTIFTSTVLYGYQVDGKPQSITIMDDDGSTSLQTLIYDAMGRLSATTTESFDAFDSGSSVTVVTVQYTESDLIEKSSSVTKNFAAGSSTPFSEYSDVQMFTYEAQSCERQTLVNPILRLFVEVGQANSNTIADRALSCGYFLSSPF